MIGHEVDPLAQGRQNSDRRYNPPARCIAVIEDEPTIADLLRDILESEGYVVLTFLRPDRFESGTLQVNPAVFLIDMMLPGMGGIIFAEQLRDDGYAETPMIALSASRTMCDAAMRSRLFQDTIAKPFELSVLVDSVGRLSNVRRSIAG